MDILLRVILYTISQMNTDSDIISGYFCWCVPDPQSSRDVVITLSCLFKLGNIGWAQVEVHHPNLSSRSTQINYVLAIISVKLALQIYVFYRNELQVLLNVTFYQGQGWTKWFYYGGQMELFQNNYLQRNLTGKLRYLDSYLAVNYS
jgi:hypothetical protein